MVGLRNTPVPLSLLALIAAGQFGFFREAFGVPGLGKICTSRRMDGVKGVPPEVSDHSDAWVRAEATAIGGGRWRSGRFIVVVVAQTQVSENLMSDEHGVPCSAWGGAPLRGLPEARGACGAPTTLGLRLGLARVDE